MTLVGQTEIGKLFRPLLSRLRRGLHDIPNIHIIPQ